MTKAVFLNEKTLFYNFSNYKKSAEFWEFNSILIFRFLFWIQPNCLDNYTTLTALFYGLILLCNKLWGYWIKAINMISFQTLLQGILTYLVWNFQNFLLHILKKIKFWKRLEKLWKFQSISIIQKFQLLITHNSNRH